MVIENDRSGQPGIDSVRSTTRCYHMAFLLREPVLSWRRPSRLSFPSLWRGVNKPRKQIWPYRTDASQCTPCRDCETQPFLRFCSCLPLRGTGIDANTVPLSHGPALLASSIHIGASFDKQTSRSQASGMAGTDRWGEPPFIRVVDVFPSIGKQHHASSVATPARGLRSVSPLVWATYLRNQSTANIRGRERNLTGLPEQVREQIKTGS